jgi:hypothetical protein
MMKVLKSKFIYECTGTTQKYFGQKKTTPTLAWRVRMGFNITIGKLQHIQNINDMH